MKSWERKDKAFAVKLMLMLALLFGAAWPTGIGRIAADGPPPTDPPVVVHATWNVEPGQIVGIYGANFAGGAQLPVVKALPLSSGLPVSPASATVALTVVNAQDNLIEAIFPATAPSDTYAVWVETAAGTSDPFWFNRAEPFWLSETTAYEGQQVRLFGRNFANPVTGSVYNTAVTLVDAVYGNRIAASVAAASAYTVDFVVPAAAIGGEYRVEVSNGAGGAAGNVTLDNEQPLTVIARNANANALETELGLSLYWLAEIPHNQRFNVRTYGATGNGVTDDTYGIQAAIDAASAAGGGIVFFPEGTYSFSSFWIHDRTILLGEGKDETKLVYNGGNVPDYPRTIIGRSAFTTGNYGEARKLLYSDGSYSGVVSLSIVSDIVRPQDDTRRRIQGYVAPIAFLGTPKSDQQYGELPVPNDSPGYLVKDVGLDIADGTGAILYATELNVIEDTEVHVTHTGLETGVSKLVRLRNNQVSNTMRPAAYAPAGHIWFENNTLTGISYESYWPSVGFRFNESTSSIEHRYGDFPLTANYIANNHTQGVFGSPTGNEGEGLLWQGAARLIYSQATSADAQSLTDTTASYTNTYIDRTVLILSGKGIGQLRKITGHTGNTLTLDRPWDVVPGPGSAYTVDKGPAMHNIIVNNLLEGQTNKGGIMFYTKDYDNIIDGNTLRNTGGIWLAANHNTDRLRADYSYFTLVKNNTLSGSSKPGHGQGNTLAIGPGTDGGIEASPKAGAPSTGVYGNEIRNNDLTSIGTDVPFGNAYQEKYVTRSGIVVSTPGELSYPMAQGVIVAGNRIRQAYAGVHLADSSFDTVLADNDFAGNRTAIKDTGSVRTILIHNGQPVPYRPIGTADLAPDGSAKVSWPPVAYAHGYTVSRSAYEAGPFEPLATVTGTTYVDPQAGGQAYYYALQSLDAANVAGDPYIVKAKMSFVTDGTFDTPGRAFQMAFAGNTAYIADQGAIRIVDVSNPGQMQEVSSIVLAGNTKNVFLDGTRLYATDTNKLYAIDVSNRTQPTLLGSLAITNAGNVRVAGNTAYVARGTSGIGIYNVANPAAMTLIRNVGNLGNVNDFDVQGNYAYVAAQSSGLKIIDISVPSAAAVVGTYSDVVSTRAVTVHNGYAYVADSTNAGAGGLLVLDVSTPSSPSFVSRLNTGSGTLNVEIIGPYAFLSEYLSKIVVASIGDPLHPQLIGEYASNSSVFQTVTMNDGTVFAVNSYNGLKALHVK